MEKISINGYNLQAICFDYYGTLVQAGNGKPFMQIDNWIRKSIIGKIDSRLSEQMIMSFAKERARLLYHSTEFLTGKRLLENSYSIVCHKYQIVPENELFINYVEDIFSNTVLFENTKYVMDLLRNNYVVGLVTNADNDILMKSLNKHDLSFDFIISSESAGYNKPDKEIFHKVFKKLGMRPEQILMVGDSWTEDIIPAKELNMSCIWMNKTNGTQKLYHDTIQISDIIELLNICNIQG